MKVYTQASTNINNYKHIMRFKNEHAELLSMTNGSISSSARNDFKRLLLTAHCTAWLNIIANTANGKRRILKSERPTKVT